MKKHKYIKEPEYNVVKAKYSEAIASPYAVSSAVIKWLAQEHDVNPMTIRRLVNSKNYGEFRPAKNWGTKPSYASAHVPTSDIRIENLINAVRELQDRVVRLEEHTTAKSWLKR